MDRDAPDPIETFFPGVPIEDVDLYAALNVARTASDSDIKQAYRKLALLHHPDKHVNSAPQAQADASTKFQQIGFAYTVLSDKAKREKYNKTGRTVEGSGLEPGEGGWEAYFEDLFDKVTKAKLDEMKKEYQGSDEEANDLREAYMKTEGSIDGILAEIPHSTHEDEMRFISILKPLIQAGDLSEFPAWKKGISDSKARKQRKVAGEKEAKEAEEHARELGVWEEFYGSGKPSVRKGKGKANADKEGDESALQALILKRQAKRGSAFDSLLAKYGGADAEAEGGSKKRQSKRKGKQADDEPSEEEVPSRKKAKTASKSSSAPKKRRNAVR
ncbi:hypothetical protein FRB96_009290 [Tulasnella sp. 330]|nr:hypothetical protein FRB96_009290 [Tulasnella sp. 330]KAG8880862.1 hypothetical protein FRB97_000372 [Tulasnella sp. 331]KAG8887100.1 hypothetical protein FRB98_000570 [Tulasnella sp. 332]